jgi:nucleoside-diphosphate kinase
MGYEQTLILCDGDAMARGLIGEIIARFERRGYEIAGLKLTRAGMDVAQRHYAEHAGKPYHQRLLDRVVRTPIVALVVGGEDAIAACRQTIGVADPRRALPGTIRGDYAASIHRNLVHASDSPASARREIDLWFAPDELYVRGAPTPSLALAQ